MKGYIAMHWRDLKPETWRSLSIAPCISISLVLRSCRLMLMLILSRRVSLYPAPYLPPSLSSHSGPCAIPWITESLGAASHPTTLTQSGFAQ